MQQTPTEHQINRPNGGAEEDNAIHANLEAITHPLLRYIATS